MTRLAALCLFLVLSLLPRPGWARERLAIVIVAGADTALADNLTEVAIAVIAERATFELVGTRELFPESTHRGDRQACAVSGDCWREIAAAAGAERAIIGQAEPADPGFSIELMLVNLKTGEIYSKAASAAPDLARLIASVQTGVAQLLSANESARTEAAEPRAPDSSSPEAGQPIEANGQRGAARLVGSRAASRIAPVRPSKSEARVPYFAYGAALIAVASFSAAGVVGVYAEGAPSGATRAEAQADLARRSDYARLANGLGIAGGAFSLISAAAFIWHFP